MLTEREQQIFNWIKEQPSITQKEIAERAGISRSSVSVHISNLTSKGAVLGRRYILCDSPYVMVIGAANMDIAGSPDGKLIASDSNPGAVRMSAGGVGRNIAHNLALLGSKVRLLTAFGQDANAQELKDGCCAVHVDIDPSMTIPGEPTSTYLFIMNEHGEMQLAIADMDIYRYLTPERMEERMDLIDHAAAVVIDTNLPQETLRYLADHVSAPIICDPVSTTKAKKIRHLIGRFHTLKPNRLEAELLSGITIHDDASLERAAKELLETGLKRVFISLGSDGLYCADANEAFKLPLHETKVVNMTGAGDAMVAGIAWAFTKKASLKRTGCIGLAAAEIATESASTINSALTGSAVMHRIKN